MTGSSEGCMSKIKVPADPRSGEGPVLGLQIDTFSLCPHLAGGREKGGKFLLVSSYEGTDSTQEGSTFMT